VEIVSSTTSILQKDLERRVDEIGHERHAKEQLQRQLSSQNEAHKELVQLLKKTQAGVVDELTKDGGLLARVLNSESSTQAK
jgi:septal ring factor EnvC (AmiA/AmiB activator)